MDLIARFCRGWTRTAHYINFIASMVLVASPLVQTVAGLFSRKLYVDCSITELFICNGINGLIGMIDFILNGRKSQPFQNEHSADATERTIFESDGHIHSLLLKIKDLSFVLHFMGVLWCSFSVIVLEPAANFAYDDAVVYTGTTVATLTAIICFYGYCSLVEILRAQLENMATSTPQVTAETTIDEQDPEKKSYQVERLL